MKVTDLLAEAPNRIDPKKLLKDFAAELKDELKNNDGFEVSMPNWHGGVFVDWTGKEKGTEGAVAVRSTHGSWTVSELITKNGGMSGSDKEYHFKSHEDAFADARARLAAVKSKYM